MAKRPHVVMLMADQLRCDALGSYGGTFGASPNIDSLAAGSVQLDNHLTNCPLCVPARTSMVTGVWPHVHGAIVNAWDPGEEPYGTCRGFGTFYEALAAGGYRVEHVGTDHLRCDPPLASRHERIRFSGGIDEYRRMLGGRKIDLSACKSPCVDYEAGRAVVRDYTNANTVPWPGPAEEFLDFWLAERMVRLIERADPAEPLALMGMFWSPHCPLSCPEPYYSMYRPEELTLPANVGRWYPGQSPMQLFNLPGHVAASMTMQQWRQAWAVYLGMVRLVDECVGRVIDALARRGFLDNCLLIFTADHGEMLGSHRLFQKMCMYQEAIRVPMLVRVPDGAAGRRSQLTEHLDLAATICDYAGAPVMASSRGTSLRPIVADPAAPGRAEVFIEFNGNSGRSFQQRAIVSGQRKFIYNHGYEPEFYDLAADPMETNNLWPPGCPPRPPPPAEELRDRLNDWMRRTNDCIAMQ